MSALGRFAATAVALDVTHDVLDHVVQTDADAAGKTAERYWEGAMLAHAGGQALAQGAVLAALELATGRRSWWRVALGTAVVGATHGLLDRRWPVVRLLERTGSARFAHPRVQTHGVVRHGHLVDDPPFVDASGSLPLHGVYLADQALHRGVTLLVALLVVGEG